MSHFRIESKMPNSGIAKTVDGILLARRDSLNVTSVRFREVWSVGLIPVLGFTGAPAITGDGRVAGVMQAMQAFRGKYPQNFFKAVPETDISSILDRALATQGPIEFPKLGAIQPDILANLDPGALEGHNLVAAGDLAGVAEKFRSALQKHPQSASVMGDLAYCLNGLGDSAKAQTTLEEAIRLAPGNLQLRLMLGSLFGDRGDTARVITYFEELTAQFPKFAIAWARLGAALFDAGRKDEALSALKRYPDLEPDSIQAWSGYAEYLLKAGNYAESRQAKERASELESLLFKLRYSAPKRE